MKRLALLSGVVALALACAVPAVALTFYDFNYFAKGGTVRLSTDPFSNSSSQHQTELEPDTFAYGNTIVMVVQQGRFYDGGASDIGWATSTNGGKAWKHGSLPKITNLQNPPGQWDRVSDPSIAYDVKHKVWLAATLPLTGATGQVPLVSASTDGLKWGDPVEVGNNNGDFQDKSWIACDNGKSSPYEGNCYVEFDDADQGFCQMTVSSNGGKTWSTPQAVSNAYGLGGQPLVQPTGTVIVPFEGGTQEAFSSTDGGSTWGNVVNIVPQINFAFIGGQLRVGALPSAEIDGNGTVYVAWPDCSFRSGCSENDIVYSTSSDGINWSSLQRVPIDAVNSTVNHFIPGIAVDPATAGKSAHIAVTYYYYPQGQCSGSCQLTVGTIASANGGSTWTKPKTLSGPMNTAWLAQTNQGYMVGDYISTSWVNGVAYGGFALATAPKTLYNEYLATEKAGQKPVYEVYPNTSWGERPIRGIHSRYRPSLVRPI